MRHGWTPSISMHLLAEVSTQGYKIFSVEEPAPSKRSAGSILYVKNSLNPIEIKSKATRTKELIKVDINPKNTTHIKLVLLYRNTRITAADDDAFNATLEEILLTKHECVIMGDFNLPHNDWSLLDVDHYIWTWKQIAAIYCRQWPFTTCAGSN